MLAWLLRLHDGLTRLTFWGAVLAVLYVTAVTAWEVLGRYLLRAPSDWAPDTSAVAFAYITFLAAPMLTWKAGHAAMTLIVEQAPRAASVWMLRFSQLVGAATCGLCGYYGAVEGSRQVLQGVAMIAVTPIPKWSVTLVIVYGLISMALYFLRQLAASFRRSGQSNGEPQWSGTFS